MAEVLVALGGAAAATQLVHYGFDFLIAASALSHNIRHAPQNIQGWMDQLTAMIWLLHGAQQTANGFHSGILGLLEECRKDAMKLQLLLRPFRPKNTQQTPSKISQRMFVLRKQTEIERLVVAFRSTFNTLASHLTM
jgi:hypothetical protein